MNTHLDKSRKEKFKKFFIFGIVGIVGTVINTGVLWLLTSFGMFYIFASIIATEIAIISNFIGNNIFTFRGNKDPSSLKNKFVKFQLISLTTIIGTVTILWMLTISFGKELLLVWNLIAIVIMFLLNFILNSKFTWRDKKFALLFVLIMIPLISSQVSVSQMGYHPDALKQAVVYTHENTGDFSIKNLDGEIVYSGSFMKAKDYDGNEVECQGNNPCLVGDFSDFKTPGEYYILAETGGDNYESYDFVIDSNIYKDNSDVFFEFFNAMRQQNSEYHSDFHGHLDPSFRMTTDGSFLMPSEDASVALISLGKAYSRNPQFFDNDVNNNGKKDITENIEIYVNYIKNLQGLELEDSSEGFRTDETIRINNAFVPGHLNESPYLQESNGNYSLKVYAGENEISGSPFKAVSLCGNLEGSQYSTCLTDAERYYKTQENEPGINISYIGSSKEVASRNVETNGYGVAKGWYYEFGCYFDVTLDEKIFENDYNPCMIFDDEENILTTSKSLYGFLVSVPAIYDESESQAGELVSHSIKTYDYIEENYNTDVESSPYIGASLFLLYDYTGNQSYLEKAHSLKENVEKDFSLWNHDKDFYYWEEYVKHRQHIENSSLEYQVDGQNPEEILRGHLFHEYKDAGLAVSKNGERVVERYRSEFDFSNSRAMLITGNFAAKTIDLYENYLDENYEDFFRTIPDSQISWLTGTNVVQPSVAESYPANESFSFIFGIGDNNPTEYHSRYLIDTGISSESNGKFIGIRGTGYRFHNGSELIDLDGYQEIMGHEFGVIGNGYNNESQRQKWDTDKVFNNGKEHIPGWINGPYDHSNDNDVIFNYDDNRDTYEFTESTNEMVASAVELFSYQDAYYNNKSRHSLEGIDFEVDNATLKIDSNVDAEVSINDNVYGLTPVNVSLQSGGYDVTLSAEGYETNITMIELAEGEIYEHYVVLKENNINGKENESNGSDTTPPSSISDIEMVSKSFNWIYWTWSNPLEEDFDKNLIYINDVNKINTSNNHYNATSLDSDTEYTIKIHTKDVVGNVNSVDVSDIQVTEVNNGNNETSNENETGQTSESIISSNYTNLSQINNSENDADYFIHEIENAYFNVSSNNSVSWKVNGKEITTTLENHEFEWSPGVLYSGSQKFTYANVSASSENEVVVWKIDVRDVINPFFDPSSGGGNTLLNIYTYDDYKVYDDVSAKITNPAKTSNTIYVLNSSEAGNNETNWKKSITFGQSYTHHLVEIELKKGNETSKYNFDLDKLGYHKNPPEETSDGGGSSGSGSGGSRGGGGGSAYENIEIVYVVLDKSRVDLNGNVVIKLDAKSERRINKVEAVFLIQNGNLYTQELELSEGSKYYGTWRKSMSDFPVTGLYELYDIKIEGYEQDVFKPDEERSFYVVSGSVDDSEELGLVYTVLSQNEVYEQKDVSLTLDARDAKGIIEVNAYIELIRSGEVLDSFVLPLQLISGNKNYGTWQGNIPIMEGDSTYEVKTIILRNVERSKEILISDRGVYANSNLPVTIEQRKNIIGITGLTIGSETLRKPLFPLVVAFIILVFVSLFFILSSRGQKNDR